jgi:hypothetical protein
MKIHKNCKRLDFSTGSLKSYIGVGIGELCDTDYLMERLLDSLLESLSLPPHSMGRD